MKTSYDHSLKNNDKKAVYVQRRKRLRIRAEPLFLRSLTVKKATYPLKNATYLIFVDLLMIIRYNENIYRP